MDPLSIASSAVGLATFAAKMVEVLGQFVCAVHDAPETVAIFHENIRHLYGALDHVGRVFKHHRQEPFEQAHHASIRQILDSCQKVLHDLSAKLPELASSHVGGYGLLQQTCDALALKLREDTIRDLWQQLNSYAQVLQLSISTLSLASLWRNQRSQDQIQHEIRALTDKIRSSGLIASWDDDTETLVDDVGLDRELRQWRASADDVAEAVTLRRPDSSTKLPMAPPASPTEEIDVPSFGRSEPLGQDVLEYCFGANQKIVGQLVECGLFLKAAQYQEKGIGCREKLSAEYAAPFTFDEQADMKERLAELLTACESRQGATRARAILKELLNEDKKHVDGISGSLTVDAEPGQTPPVESRPDVMEPTDRSCRVYHHLGKLNVSLNHLSEAKTFLEHAFGGRRRLDPMPTALVKESAQLLIEVCVQMGAIDEAEGLGLWIKDKLDQEPSSAEPSFAQGCEWCKAQGFDVDRVNFHFDSYDPTLGTTPVHLAVQKRDEEILRLMLGCLQTLGALDTVCEEQGLARPLLVAASSRHDGLVAAMVDAGAALNATDGNGQTALHRCQSKDGGCDVAERLLQTAPGLVDRVDGAGKTALFMAVEMGNDDMVAFLLADGHADANICHEAGGITVRSPLIAAIELVCRRRSKIGIVAMLLDHGADPHVADVDGWDAINWANKAGLAKDRIRLMIRTRGRGSDSMSSGVSAAEEEVRRRSMGRRGRRPSNASNFTGSTAITDTPPPPVARPKMSVLSTLRNTFSRSSRSGSIPMAGGQRRERGGTF